ncbi:MAG TPA: hypothetical protein VFW66_13530 [Gemmatimonadales bacterium]|nr:hypothetical protein [Gemmatimonadales bacterium]
MSSLVRANPMIRLALATAAGALLAACRGDAAPSSLLRKLASETRAARAHDACTLLSAGEAEPYVGTLAAPPYRSSDGAPDPGGDQCTYRGSDGREVTIRPVWGGGRLIGKVLHGVPTGLGAVLDKGAPGLDTMANRVMKSEPGPWDQATWIPGGSLFASRGEAEVSIDVSGASGRESDALALAKLVVPRFEHPLDYDGVRAVALAPKPRAHPAHACDLVSRSEVEAAVGRLSVAPTSDSPETSCTWRVATADGERAYPVEVVWEGGQKNYMMLTHGMAMVGGLIGAPASSPLDTMKPPPEMQAAIGGLMKMVGGGGGAARGAATAPGAAAKVGFQTDTTLKGPWDRAALLHGTQLIAVRHDVFVGMDLGSADYEKAKALMSAICARL